MNLKARSFAADAVRGMQQGLFASGESQDSPSISHWREALPLRSSRMRQGVQQRIRSGQAPEPNTLECGLIANSFPSSNLSCLFKRVKEGIVGVDC